jgi:DNA (cytosine-5)-methyltransferase 1
MAAYYNENDPKTAAWLKENIRAGLVADGEVDERSIADVAPEDLRGFTQCHFFAGIGGWSYALRLAGCPDDQHVWTGSCPCQPWSMAGEGKGIDDPRHLWPTWFRLIEVCRPATVFGEQTSSLDGLYWIDLVYDGLETSDYAVGTSDISGACLGSPDIRPRLWFVADTDRTELPGFAYTRPEPLHGGVRKNAGWLADSKYTKRRPVNVSRQDGQQRENNRREKAYGEPGACSEVRRVAYRDGARLEKRSVVGRMEPGAVGAPARKDAQRDGLLGGFWSNCEWVYCRPEPRYPEGCYRPIEPGSFPLATGLPARILRLRGYGNAIKPTLAAEFIRAYTEARRGATR